MVLTREARTRVSCRSLMREISSSPRKILPALGRWMPPNNVNNVDFPDPLGPRNATRSPAATLRSTPCSATTSCPSNVLYRCTRPWHLTDRPPVRSATCSIGAPYLLVTRLTRGLDASLSRAPFHPVHGDVGVQRAPSLQRGGSGGGRYSSCTAASMSPPSCSTGSMYNL